MGHSSLDPAFQGLRAWNEGRVLGAKRALKPQQLWAICFWRDEPHHLWIERFSTARSTASCAVAML